MHMAQLMPLPLTVSCYCKIQIGFTFLVPAHPGSPGKRAVKRVCVCACACESSLLQLCLSITSCKSRRRHPAHDCSQFHRLATVLCCSPARRYARIIVIVVIKRSRDSCINRSVYYRAPLNIDAQFLDSDLCSAEWQTGGRSTNSVVICSATHICFPTMGVRT